MMVRNGEATPRNSKRRRLPRRFVWLGSVGLFVAGIFMLSVHLSRPVAPAVSFGSCSSDQNFSMCTVKGVVVADAKFTPTGGLLFKLQDGTGRCTVRVNQCFVSKLEQRAHIPLRGDRVSLVGVLYVDSEQEVSVRLSAVRSMRLTPRSIPSGKGLPRIAWADLESVAAGERIVVQGVLSKITIPRPGSRKPTRCVIQKGESTLDVVIWNRLFRGGVRTLPVPGARVEALGRIGIYRGQRELTLSAVENLREISAD